MEPDRFGHGDLGVAPAGPPLKRGVGATLGRGFLAVIGFFAGLGRGVGRYFRNNDPTFWKALLPAMAVSVVLYMRLPTTNYIFDEQEALLANPYVNQIGFNYEDAIYRDFWGLPPNASIGSYRPIPNYLWRLPVEGGERLQKGFDAVQARYVQIPPEQRTRPVVFGVSIAIIPITGILVGVLLWLASTRKHLAARGLLQVGAGVAAFVGTGALALTVLLNHRMFEAFGETLPKFTELGRSSYVQDWYNLILHGVNAALFAAIAFRVTRRRLFGWLTGATFVTAAILTEAVSGCVGIADILGGLGALLALAALGLRGHAMPFGVFLAITFGLFSKESAVVCVPLVPVAALVAAPLIHPEKPARLARAALAFVGALAAFILYVELRKRWFPSPLPSDLAEPIAWDAPLRKQVAHDFLVWFHQAPLPKDPLNNPLASAEPAYRVAGAMRVYARGLSQVVFPWTLSGDYSSPQEPAPTKLVFPESIIGAALTIVPLLVALVFWILSLFRSRRAGVGVATELLDRRRRIARIAFEIGLVVVSAVLVRGVLKLPAAPDSEAELEKHVALSLEQLRDLMIFAGVFTFAAGLLVESSWSERPGTLRDWPLMVVAIGLVWLVVSYFPHSNIPVVLPTVRAERLWYFPVIGTTMVIAAVLTLVVDAFGRRGWRLAAVLVPTLFLGFQGARAYIHATDYRDDLVFWEATKDAVPNSSKAHLNYSVMVGARGDMATRLLHSIKARDLAPDWAMAHVYTGDTLCRQHRAEEAWPYYKSGFVIGTNDRSLLALGLQCLWDEGVLKNHDAELRQMATDHPGSWLAYLAVDTLDRGTEHGGVDPQYRPRSYNEGPKKKATDTEATGDETANPSADPTATLDVTVEPTGTGSVVDAWELGTTSAKASAKSALPTASTGAPSSSASAP